MEIFSQVIGWVGTFLVVLAYYLVSTKKIDAGSKYYQYLNLFGAVGLGFNVLHQQAWPALALQVVWGVIAIFSLMRLELKTIFVKKK